MSPIGKRIAVVGTTGTGKSFVARRLSEITHSPHVELDRYFWKPNWERVDDEVFQRNVEAATSADAWVADGNYSSVRDNIWKRAETLVWLDYPFLTAFSQLLLRTASRIITGERICGENKENLAKLFSKSSIIVWFFQTFWRRRREYAVAVRMPQFAHLTLIRLRSRKETNEFLAGLPTSNDS